MPSTSIYSSGVVFFVGAGLETIPFYARSNLPWWVQLLEFLAYLYLPEHKQSHPFL